MTHTTHFSLCLKEVSGHVSNDKSTCLIPNIYFYVCYIPVTVFRDQIDLIFFLSAAAAGPVIM